MNTDDIDEAIRLTEKAIWWTKVAIVLYGLVAVGWLVILVRFALR